MKPTLNFVEEMMTVSDLGESSCVPDLYGEVVLQNQLEFELDEDDELFEAYGRRKNAYPYRKYNTYTRELKKRPVKTAVLENQYLKAVFLTEYGGRLWSLWDKEADRNLLYTNDVIRFSNLAVCNAWFSGGVEWNIGIIGHSPFTTAPLYVVELKDEQGNPVLRMYEYERVRQVTYQMDFWLEEESRFLNCRMRIANDTDQVVPMYWWSNIAVPEYEGGRVVVPTDRSYAQKDGSHGKKTLIYKTDIPYVDNIDVTDYKTIPDSGDYFFDIPDGTPRYIANLDKDGYGLLQMSTDRQRGRKLFTWGNAETSDRWQEFLTEKAGRYIEIQAGLAKTQYGCIPMPPHRVWEWIEQYGAVKLPENLMKAEHKDRYETLTKQLLSEDVFEKMERKLKQTKAMAKTKGRLIQTGSGYGALVKRGACTEHLEFVITEDGLKEWKKFLETGVLYEPSAMERPAAFFCDEESVTLLKKTIHDQNRENWYAHYLLGVCLYEQEEFAEARAQWEKSLELCENPWALHGLACVSRTEGKKKECVSYMIKGMRYKRTDCSYLKEGFMQVFRCEGYEELKAFYEELAEKEQKIARLKFFYISALHKLGFDKKAYELLEENGGLDMEDIREGEDSVIQLWSELHQNLYGEKGIVPFKYRFKSYD